MSSKDFDLLIHNGRIASTSTVSLTTTWIGIKGNVIDTLSDSPPDLSSARRVIDARGAYITPGGIDSHVHLQQLHIDPAEDTGDTFYSGTRSAIAGGTTTIIAFANQQRHDETLFPLVREYHQRAKGEGETAGCWSDYAFHLILTNPTTAVLDELETLRDREGITSIKVYMTYEARRVTDRNMLDILLKTRELGLTLMVHAENDDMVSMVIEHLRANTLTDPFHHALARPPLAEDEATNRAIALSRMISAPILIVHVSSQVAMARILHAQNEMQPIFAETCPQYLFLLAHSMLPPDSRGCHCSHAHLTTAPRSIHPPLAPHIFPSVTEATSGYEGAKLVCSPPPRVEPRELEAVWKGLINGTVTTFSSDHCPSKYDHPKDFTKIPNGLPGVETRQPLLMTYGVEAGRITIQRFVEVVSTNPARLYGLQHRKGVLAPGMDADLVIWHPPGIIDEEITNARLHHAIDYTPFEGIRVTNWPRYTVLRGNVVFDREVEGGVIGKPLGAYVKKLKGDLGWDLCDEVNHLERIHGMSKKVSV